MSAKLESYEMSDPTLATIGEPTGPFLGPNRTTGMELKERITEAMEKAKVTCKKMGEKANQGVKATDKAIHNHPYQAIGIALGLGVLIGVLARRK